MRRPPLGFADDALVAEVGKEQHVGGPAIDHARAGDAVAADAIGAAERRDDRFAERRDDLGQPSVGRRTVDAGGVPQGYAGMRGVETLEKAARLARQVRPRRGRVAPDERLQERRRVRLGRMFELQLGLLHASSLIRNTARKASWGISTDPTIFMRFLPSFCFSSSFFFRVMSPPYHF